MPGEAAACAHVEYGGAFVEGAEEPGYGQGVDHVVEVEVVDVLAGYYVYFCVPVGVEGGEGVELLALAVGEAGEEAVEGCGVHGGVILWTRR